MAPSPVVARWELSRRLANRRKELGVGVESIAEALGFSRNYWSAVENDRTLIAEDKLRLLFELLQFGEQDQQELLQLREESRAKGWWDEFPSLSDAAKRIFGLEHGAVKIRTYDGQVMPGLLQIEPYARAVIGADPAIRPVEIEQVIEVRRRRQQLLDGETAPSVIALLAEAALHQQVAGPHVQVQQLGHIHRLASAPESSVDIRILPFDVNPGVIVGSSTLLLFTYASVHLPEIAIQEAVRQLDPIDSDHEEYTHMDLAWKDGLSRSLSPTDSLGLISTIADELAK
jgi:transcriptional regulator with XRE-family HTH domain